MSGPDVTTLAQSGQLMPNDLVWKEGSETKLRAEQIKGLAFKSPQVVPPSPAVEDPRPGTDNVPPAENEPKKSNEQREFYYEMDGENQGPVSLSELQESIQQGVVTKETRVWHDGLDDWTLAFFIVDLVSSFPVFTDGVGNKSPPPLKISTSQNVKYRFLRNFAALYKIVSLLNVGICLFLIMTTYFVMESRLVWGVYAGCVLVYAVISSIILGAFVDFIQLAIDVEEHLRVIRGKRSPKG